MKPPIVVVFNASSLCNKDNWTNWDCGLDQIDNELAPICLRTGCDNIAEKRMYSIKDSSNRLSPFLNCDQTIGDSWYHGIKSCKYTLENLILTTQESPIGTIIEISEIHDTRISEKFYMKKIYWL